jgi:hypothetical protein
LAIELKYTPEAKKQYAELSASKHLQKRFKAVRKSLRFLSENPAHPSLQTHKYDSIKGPDDLEVFEAYAEQKTPAAYRSFWCYYPAKTKANPTRYITILAITPHP